jgi:hypothetical protein
MQRIVRLLAFVLVLATRAFADPLEGPAIPDTDLATITSVDTEEGRLHVHSLEGPLFYRVTADTHIEREGQPIALEDLAIGERVVIEADETSPGLWTARSVIVVAGGGVPAEAMGAR